MKKAIAILFVTSLVLSVSAQVTDTSRIDPLHALEGRIRCGYINDLPHEPLLYLDSALLIRIMKRDRSDEDIVYHLPGPVEEAILQELKIRKVVFFELSSLGEEMFRISFHWDTAASGNLNDLLSRSHRKLYIGDEFYPVRLGEDMRFQILETPDEMRTARAKERYPMMTVCMNTGWSYSMDFNYAGKIIKKFRMH